MTRDTLFDTLRELFDYPFARIVATVLAVMLLQFVLRVTIGFIVRRAVRGHRYETRLDEQKREETLTKIFRTALAVLLWTVAVLVILVQLNVNLAALMTGAGLIGIVVGFGAQTAIRDFLAGVFIIMENQYRVGDVVELDSAGSKISGVVEDITIRITRLRDLDGNMHIVPNGSATFVTNLTFKYANVNVDIGVSYDSDIDKVERVINKVGEQLAKDDAWKNHIFEPIQFLRVDAFDEMAVRIKALGKVEPAAQWDIAGEFRRRIIRAFAENKIKIPYPQIVLQDSGGK